MGYCALHGQSYAEQFGGFCPYCGNPATMVRTVTASGTGSPPSAPEMDAIVLACVEACFKAYREGRIYVNDFRDFASDWLKQQHP